MKLVFYMKHKVALNPEVDVFFNENPDAKVNKTIFSKDAERVDLIDNKRGVRATYKRSTPGGTLLRVV